jgi:hypothetical protein
VGNINCSDTIDNTKVPAGIIVAGINDKNIEPELVKNENTGNIIAYMKVLVPDLLGGLIYENQPTTVPDLPAIHGVDDQNDIKNELYWGSMIAIRKNTFDITMTTAFFVWFMYNLIELIGDYISIENKDNSGNKNRRSLPNGISKAIWLELKKFNEKRGKVDIYNPREDLTDNYIGKLIKIILPNKDKTVEKDQINWKIDTRSFSYSVPLDFYRFTLTQYHDVMSHVAMSTPKNITLAAQTVHDSKNVTDKSTINFTLNMLVFNPVLFYSVSTVKEKKVEISMDDIDDG